jgi:hypothetical protein
MHLDYNIRRAMVSTVAMSIRLTFIAGLLVLNEMLLPPLTVSIGEEE